MDSMTLSGSIISPQIFCGSEHPNCKLELWRGCLIVLDILVAALQPYTIWERVLNFLNPTQLNGME